MLEIVILYCLADQPAACEEHVTTLAGEVGQSGCFVMAQQIGAAWLALHPGRVMGKWTCQDVVFHKQRIHREGTGPVTA